MVKRIDSRVTSSTTDSVPRKCSRSYTKRFNRKWKTVLHARWLGVVYYLNLVFLESLTKNVMTPIHEHKLFDHWTWGFIIRIAFNEVITVYSLCARRIIVILDLVGRVRDTFSDCTEAKASFLKFLAF